MLGLPAGGFFNVISVKPSLLRIGAKTKKAARLSTKPLAHFFQLAQVIPLSVRKVNN